MTTCTPFNRFVLCGLFLLSCFPIPSIHAQPPGEENATEYLELHRQQILGVLTKNTPKGVNKPTGSKQRVIGQCFRFFPIVDSTTFNYSGSRGSTFDYNIFRYRNYLTASYTPNDVLPHSDNALDLLADKIGSYKDGVWQYTDHGFYRTNNMLDSVVSNYNNTVFDPDLAKTILVYNNPDHPSRGYYMAYNSAGPADTTMFIDYYYTNGKLTQDTTLMKNGNAWVKSGTNQYNYNSNGALSDKFTYSISGSITQITQEAHYSYYPDERLRKVYTLQYSSGAVTDTLIDSLAYQGTTDYTSYWETRRLKNSASTYNSSYLEIRYPDTSGLPDSAFVSIGYSNNTSLDTRYKYSINSFGNPDRIIVFEEGNTSANPDRTYDFYYEVYDDGVGVEDLFEKSAISIYPNPFDRQLSITSNLGNGKLDVSLTNIACQQFFKGNIIITGGAGNITLPMLPAGYYFLEMRDQIGNIYTKKLVRR